MSTRAILPTLLTLGNAVCGLAAIAFASKIGKVETPADLYPFYLALSGWLILTAMVFDTFDGVAARLTKSTSAFGAELDSLCDAISFGVAPAFLLLQLGPSWQQPYLHQALATVAAVYMLAVILRLAHYNVEALSPAGTGNRKFRGLPSPAAAGCVATLAVVRGQLAWSWPAFDTATTHRVIEALALAGAPVVAALMVSPLPYPHLTKHILRRGPVRLLVPGGLALVLLVVLRDAGLSLLFWAYAVSAAVQPLRRGLRRGTAGVRVAHPVGVDDGMGR